MSGTIPISMTQQLDQYGNPLAGGKLYIIQAGTVSTPQNGFQDSALTLPWPNPITLDASGRIPQFFLADGLIKIRLQDNVGVVQLVADNIQVIGPSGGGGGGGSVDATSVLQTGDLKPRYGTGTHTGWVRCNNLTIGSATSGANERANADCQSLFQYLWGADVNLVVSGGRGASAAADWNANKQLTLPDWRGRALAFLDDMGSSAAGRLTQTLWGAGSGSPIVLGAAGGIESTTLATANLPPYTPTGVVVNGAITLNISPGTLVGTPSTTTGTVAAGANLGGYTAQSISASQAASTFFANAQGGVSTPFTNAAPSMLATMYIKL